MVKILSWNTHSGSYCVDENGDEHPIQDISEDDVLAIMRLILNDSSVIEMDPVPTDKDNVNPAALVIYEELHKQFTSMIDQRATIIERIEKKFDSARSYYSQDNVIDLFDEPALPEG